MKLVAAKTMILVFTTKETEMKAKVELASHRVCINGADISPSTQATHVGVVRSAEGNGPNILARLSQRCKKFPNLVRRKCLTIKHCTENIYKSSLIKSFTFSVKG